MAILQRNSRDFFLHFGRAYPWRTASMVGLLVLSGLAEGVGVATLLPILEYGVADPGAETSPVGRAFAEILTTIGLEPTLLVLLSIIVVAMSLKGAFRWLAMREVGYVVARVAMDLRLRLIRAIMHAEWTYFTSQPIGHFANAISSEAHRSASAYREACSALAGLIRVVVYGVFVFLVSWKIAVLSAVVGLAILSVLSGLVDRARRAGRQQTSVARALIRRLTEALPSIKPVKAMAREHLLLPLLEAETFGYNVAQQRQVAASESLRSFQEPLLVLALAIGLYSILQATSTPFATVLVLAFLFYRLVGSLNTVQSQYQTMAIGESAYFSMASLIREAEASCESQVGTIPAPVLSQGVEFRNVSFAYAEAKVLDEVDLSIQTGQFVALIGPSGSGKTTIADLVVGLVRPTSGEILVDGVSLASIDAVSWRSRIGYVPQDLLLFHDTVEKNLTLGNENISSDQVERALRDAGAWKFVNCHPDGVQQIVGERGALLSGGQRQRIAIARALVEQPQLLILDEATTALDPETERDICRTLVKLKDHVTILAISHQAAIREVADIVYEVDSGRVRLWSEVSS